MIAVYVVQLQRNRLIHPDIEFAGAAPVFKDAFVDESPAQSIRLNRILSREVVRYRSHTVWNRRAS